MPTCFAGADDTAADSFRPPLVVDVEPEGTEGPGFPSFVILE